MNPKLKLLVVRFIASLMIAAGHVIAANPQFGAGRFAMAESIAPPLTQVTIAAGGYTQQARGHYTELVTPTQLYFAAGGYAAKGKSGLDCIAVDKSGVATVLTLPPPAKTAQWNGLTCGLTLAKASDAIDAPIWAQITVVNDGDKEQIVGGGCSEDLEINVWALTVTDSSGQYVRETPLGQLVFLGRTVCATTWQVGVPPHRTQTIIVNLRELFDLPTKGTYTVDFAPKLGWHGGPSTPITFTAG